jgi:1,4-dihydroxy-6-naphthoate synthase
VVSRALEADIREKIERLIRESIEFAFANPTASRDFVKAHARELDDAVIYSHIALFVNDNSLTLSPEARLSIKTLTGVTAPFF